MKKDITSEKIMLGGEIARQYGCCFGTIDRRLNPDKYHKEKSKRIYTSKLDDFKNIVDNEILYFNIKRGLFSSFKKSTKVTWITIHKI